MRSSIYKEKILLALQKSHLMSIADIQKKVLDADFSTIFRNLEQLVSDGLVKKVLISKDTVLYEVCTGTHAHDHFVCADCGTVEAVNIPKISLKGNAVVTDVLVRGTCSSCIG